MAYFSVSLYYKVHHFVVKIYFRTPQHNITPEFQKGVRRAHEITFTYAFRGLFSHFTLTDK